MTQVSEEEETDLAPPSPTSGLPPASVCPCICCDHAGASNQRAGAFRGSWGLGQATDSPRPSSAGQYLAQVCIVVKPCRAHQGSG